MKNGDNRIVNKILTATVTLVISGCGLLPPADHHLDPCHRALKCTTSTGSVIMRDPTALGDQPGSGTPRAPTLVIRDRQGRQLGTIR